MLTYQAAAVVDQRFSELLAADLEDDERAFYASMAFDIAIVASGVERPPHVAAIVQTLLKALLAPRPTSAAHWQLFYRWVAILAAGCVPETISLDLRAELVRPLARLRQFLAENSDLGDEWAVENLTRTASCERRLRAGDGHLRRGA